MGNRIERYISINKSLLLFILCFMISLLSNAQSRSETLVNELEHQRFTASVNEDFGFLQSVFSDKLEYCRSNGVVDNKANYLETIKSGEVKYTELSIVNIETKQYAKRVVINRGTVKISVKASNHDDKPYILYFTSVYVKEKDGWKIVSIQSTKVN